jgi:hypothetical protein
LTLLLSWRRWGKKEKAKGGRAPYCTVPISTTLAKANSGSCICFRIHLAVCTPLYSGGGVPRRFACCECESCCRATTDVLTRRYQALSSSAPAIFPSLHSLPLPTSPRCTLAVCALRGVTATFSFCVRRRCPAWTCDDRSVTRFFSLCVPRSFSSIYPHRYSARYLPSLEYTPAPPSLANQRKQNSALFCFAQLPKQKQQEPPPPSHRELAA